MDHSLFMCVNIYAIKAAQYITRVSSMLQKTLGPEPISSISYTKASILRIPNHTQIAIALLPAEFPFHS